MTVRTVDSGQSEKTVERINLVEGIGGFIAGAAATTVVTDAGVKDTSRVIIFPTSASAGLLVRSKSCYVIPDLGFFTFTVSASGAGAPAGTESFGYITLNDIS